MSLLQSFLIDTKISVHTKTQLSISEERVNTRCFKKNKNKGKESMCICDGRRVRRVKLTN